MSVFILVLVSLALFASFLGLTAYEARSGVRFFGAMRAQLDSRVSRAAFIFKHVDLTAFLSQVAKDTIANVAHFVAHLSLVLVRAVERSLTRFVRYLRGRRAQMNGVTTSAASTSPFVETMAYFKHTLRRSKQVPPPAETTAEGEVK